MNITRIGLDLAKSVFQVHAVDHKGHRLFSRALKREKMMAFFQNLSPLPDRNGGLRQLPLLGQNPDGHGARG